MQEQYSEFVLPSIQSASAATSHTPENCEPQNLKAMCQRCHLTYDADHHARTAYATRKAAAMTADLF